MPDKFRTRERYGEVFWRKHHEAWQQSALNQREYCEAHGIPLKAFGNWRAKFKAEPQPPAPKLLYRRRGPSHTLSHRLSHSLSHMTNDLPGPIVPPAREGCRRTFSEADKRRIVEETARLGASLSEVARHYGIAARVLFRACCGKTPSRDTCSCSVAARPISSRSSIGMAPASACSPSGSSTACSYGRRTSILAGR